MTQADEKASTPENEQHLSDAGRRKRCPRCGERKLVDAFTKRTGARSGQFAAYCKPCVVKYAQQLSPEKQACRRGRDRKNQKAFRDANPERNRATQKRYRDQNPEKMKAAGVRFRRRRPDKVSEYHRKAMAKRPELARIGTANRRAKIKELGGGRLAAGLFDLLMSEQGGLCPYCLTDLTPEYEMDHYVPIARGGKHEGNNVQLLCKPCNRRKSYKHPADWLKEVLLDQCVRGVGYMMKTEARPG